MTVKRVKLEVLNLQIVEIAKALNKEDLSVCLKINRRTVYLCFYRISAGTVSVKSQICILALLNAVFTIVWSLCRYNYLVLALRSDTETNSKHNSKTFRPQECIITRHKSNNHLRVVAPTTASPAFPSISRDISSKRAPTVCCFFFVSSFLASSVFSRP